MSAPTETQMLDALFRGMNSSEYWMSVSVHAEDDMTMYLYPVNGTGEAEDIDPQDRNPLAGFHGTRIEVMTQLIAYQMAERLT